MRRVKITAVFGMFLCAMLAVGCSPSKRSRSELERQIREPGVDERHLPRPGRQRDRVYRAARERVAQRWFLQGMPAPQAVTLLKQQGFTVEQIRAPMAATPRWPQHDGVIQGMRESCAVAKLYCDEVFVQLEVSEGRVIWNGRAIPRADHRVTTILTW